MEPIFVKYLPVLIFLAIAVALAFIVVVLPFIVAPRKPDAEKLSQYECGSEVIGDGRTIFDARFYLVAMLFIIFDLEIVYIFPWAISFKDVGSVGFWIAMIFLFVLALGFVYEWKKGALEWE